jgi:ketosteroid isomerase-like protein
MIAGPPKAQVRRDCRTLVKLTLYFTALVFGLYVPGPGQQHIVSGALDSMVATERAFATAGAREGIRASFLKFFADSCIAFNPRPYRYKAAVAQAPPQPNPLRWALAWQPVAGDVSISGDLGYTMGPSTLTDTESPDAPVKYGFYFSIWQRQSDGLWKVILDIGTEVTQKIMRFWGTEFVSLHSEDGARTPADSGPAVAPDNVRAQDSLFSVVAARAGIQEAYATVLDERAWAIREDVGPIAGRDSILAFLNHEQEPLICRPLGAGISAAGDLGFTYGFCSRGSASTEPEGYYVRVWKKNAAGAWRLVLDKISPNEET